MKLRKILWLTLGFVGVALGAVGEVLPMLPAFPFLMLALFSFGKSSEKLHKWFIGTKLYKNNLESFVKGEGMTWKTKIKIMITVTLLMSFGFFMMFRKALYIPCIILGGVWVFHILYFIFGIKIKSKAERQTSLLKNTIITNTYLYKNTAGSDQTVTHSGVFHELGSIIVVRTFFCSSVGIVNLPLFKRATIQ